VTYASDAGDLAWSLPDFRTVLEGLAARHGDGNVSILAHSLGARATVEVLARMGQGEERPGPVFRDVVLVAPDIARSRFAAVLEAVERRTGMLTIYASEYDLALRLSSVVNTSARLGITDGEGSRSRKVQLVDVSGTGMHSLSGHVYHLHNPAVIEDIARLVGGTKATAEGAWERVAGPSSGVWQLLPVNGDRTATAEEDGSGKL
jgi:esterase/lipase superfamily enzyme